MMLGISLAITRLTGGGAASGGDYLDFTEGRLLVDGFGILFT